MPALPGISPKCLLTASACFTGAAPRLFYDLAAAQWQLIVEATMFVTNEVVQVWAGVKSGGNGPAGFYTRVAGLDPLASLTVERA